MTETLPAEFTQVAIELPVKKRIHRRPDIHNPDHLWDSEVETRRGWRLLHKWEVIPRVRPTLHIQLWNHETQCWVDGLNEKLEKIGWRGSSLEWTYRTRLTPSALEARAS